MLAPWKKNYNQPRQHIKKQDITLPTKVHLVKAMVFPVVTYACESWTVKKAEWRRIDAFELWYWRRLLRIPWTARRSNQSILEEISPGVHWKDWCWSWNVNILATWCEELTHLKRPWCWERLRAGGEGDYRGWDGWMASPTQVWVNSRSLWWTGRPGVLWSMRSKRVGYDWVMELKFFQHRVTVWLHTPRCLLKRSKNIWPQKALCTNFIAALFVRTKKVETTQMFIKSCDIFIQ